MIEIPLGRKVDIKKLKDAMMGKRVEVSGLAKKSGVPQSTIKNWMKGNTSPNMRTLGKVADALGVTLRSLVEEG